MQAASGTRRHRAEGSVVQAEAEIEASEGEETARGEDRKGKNMTHSAKADEEAARARCQEDGIDPDDTTSGLIGPGGFRPPNSGRPAWLMYLPHISAAKIAKTKE